MSLPPIYCRCWGAEPKTHVVSLAILLAAEDAGDDAHAGVLGVKHVPVRGRPRLIGAESGRGGWTGVSSSGLVAVWSEDGKTDWYCIEAFLNALSICFVEAVDGTSRNE